MKANSFFRLASILWVALFVVACSSTNGGSPVPALDRSEVLQTVGDVGSANNFMYVANASSNEITVYPANANGNVSPVRVVTGPHTGLNAPVAVALDSQDRLYVTNTRNNTITVYCPHANGDQRPLRTIGGDRTKLAGPLGIAVGTDGAIYVTNCPFCFSEILEGFVTIYGATANGNVSPIATLSGSKTQLSQPVGIFREPPAGPLFVANSSGNSITIYDSPFNGNIAPSRVVSGNLTQLVKPLGIALHFATGDLYVANCRSCIGAGPGTINVYSPRVMGNQGPFRVIKGNGKPPLDPEYVAVDQAGRSYLTNVGQTDYITVFATDANGSQAPVAVITGNKTRMHTVQGIAVGP